jgi:lipopolysaccharide/colanic/teichoic acid biosynthesis glycosyltransferase
MRSFRGYRLLPRRTYADVALDQMRRLADLLIAGVLILITSPLMLLVALAINWEGPGPILERETCIARGGRRFEMLKFRTMLPDPEHTMPVWARKTTQVGEFLRYTRIECLPQLINVLRGEMSILDPDGNSPSFLE